MRPGCNPPIHKRNALPKLAVLLCVAMLAGCALPRTGPSASEFRSADAGGTIDLIAPTMDLAMASREPKPAGFGPEWQAYGAEPWKIAPGDILTVTIFDRDGLNLFPPGPNGGSTIEGLAVDSAGAIQVPYVGSVPVAGLSSAQARSAIIGRLRRLSSSPDALVGVTERRSQQVSVQGDVAKPGLIPLTAESNRLSTLLSNAAPTPANFDLLTVTVRRGMQNATVPLADVFANPADDIRLRNGDVVTVRGASGYVSVLGAAGIQGRVRITRRNFTVMDAVGDARGLNDNLANPSAVYVMRLSDLSTDPSATPRVYNFDFRNPAQVAVSSMFALRDGDAVFISNVPFAQTHKVLSAFTGVLGAARSATQIAP